MSVAALTAKRHMEWDSPLQSSEFSPNCRAQQKRFRLASPSNTQSSPTSLFHKDANSRVPYNPDSHFNRPIPQSPFEKYLDAKLVKRARHRYREEVENNSSPYFRLPSPQKKEHEVLLSLDQVKTIVNRALEEREATLRQQYDVILQEKLTEQYNTFSRFNQDNIHRQMSESTFNYML